MQCAVMIYYIGEIYYLHVICKLVVWVWLIYLIGMMGRGQGMGFKANFTNVLPAGCKSTSLHLFIQPNLVLPYYDYPFFTSFTSIGLKRVLYQIVLAFFKQGGN